MNRVDFYNNVVKKEVIKCENKIGIPVTASCNGVPVKALLTPTSTSPNTTAPSPSKERQS